jgi:hypothetical protein
MTNHEPDDKLDQLLHERLRALPDQPAPADLIPNVLRKIAARSARPWWRCAWPEWPLAMQVLSCAMLLGLAGSLYWFNGDIHAYAGQLATRAASALGFLKPVWTVLSALAGAVQLLFSSIKLQYLIPALAGLAALYLGTMGISTVFYRVTLRKNEF